MHSLGVTSDCTIYRQFTRIVRIPTPHVNKTEESRIPSCQKMSTSLIFICSWFVTSSLKRCSLPFIDKLSRSGWCKVRKLSDLGFYTSHRCHHPKNQYLLFDPAVSYQDLSRFWENCVHWRIDARYLNFSVNAYTRKSSGKTVMFVHLTHQMPFQNASPEVWNTQK